MCEAAIDAGRLELRDDRIPGRIITETCRQHGLSAEPGNRVSRGRGRPAAGDHELMRAVFFATPRHAFDRIDVIERGDADAENLGHQGRSPGVTGSFINSP